MESQLHSPGIRQLRRRTVQLPMLAVLRHFLRVHGLTQRVQPHPGVLRTVGLPAMCHGQVTWDIN